LKRPLLILGTTLALTAIPVASIAAQKNDTGSSGSTGETTQAAEVSLFQIPDYGGGFSHRAALTGDWGDQRSALAQHGVQFSLDVTLAYQGVDGGIDNDDDSQGTADYRFLLDTGKAGLWARGFLELHAESYWGTSINKAVGAVSPVNLSPLMSAPAGNGTYLSHVVYTQFLTDRFALTGGKINTAVGDTNDFAHGVAFHKGYLFVADGLMGVAGYRFENPNRLNHFRQLDSEGGYADKVTVADRKLFVANDYKGLLVFDIRRPEKPTLLQ
jgi:hypothetical protein